MGWWGSPGCGCCDGCEDCLGYEETFDGSGTMTVIDWTESGDVARVSGEVVFYGSNPKARTGNSTKAARLTGNVKTTFEFQLLYDGAGLIVELIMQGVSATGSLFIFIDEDSMSVGDLENQTWIDTGEVELALNTTYVFEACVDDTNDIVYVGIVGQVDFQVDIVNGGLDYVDILGSVKPEWLPPIPPSTTGTETYPEDAILKIDNFKQFDRVDEDSNCCACERVSSPEVPSGGTLPSECVSLLCPDLTYEMAMTIANFADDTYACCDGFNGTFTIYNRGFVPGDAGCNWTLQGGCDPWFPSDVVGCCDEAGLYGYPFYAFLASLSLYQSPGVSRLRLWAYTGYWYVSAPTIRWEGGPGLFYIESTKTFDFATDGCDSLVFDNFTAYTNIPASDQNCDFSSLVVTIEPIP